MRGVVNELRSFLFVRVELCHDSWRKESPVSLIVRVEGQVLVVVVVVVLLLL